MLMRTQRRLVAAWEPWFAWYPVKAYTGLLPKLYRWIWLAHGYRRRHYMGHWQYRVSAGAPPPCEAEPR